MSIILSTRSKYGIRGLCDLAAHFRGKPVLLKDIAAREEIPLRYLENIFSKLRNAGILLSWKGKGGGFGLARPPDRINLLEVIEILEENQILSSCVSSPEACKRSDTCGSREVWVSLNEILRNFLRSISISIKQVEHENVKNKSAWRCQSSEKLLHDLRLFSCSVIAQ